MFAIQFSYTVVFAVALLGGHLVSPIAIGAEIVQPGPNTYSVSGDSGTDVLVQRTPDCQTGNDISVKPRNSPFGTVTFGEVTPGSIVAI